MNEIIRGAFVIARRDFTATVLSRAFLFFLLAPLFPLLVAAIFGSLASNMADNVESPAVAVVGHQADFIAMETARRQLSAAFPEARFIRLVEVKPERDQAAQRERLLSSTNPPIVAVLEGGLSKPHLKGAVRPDGSAARQVQLLVDTARHIADRGPSEGTSVQVSRTGRSSGSIATARALSARIGQGILFILTMLLTTMMLSQLIEEKSNKVIEVLAAAVPVDSIFLGKLLAMLSASLLGIAVWGSAGAAAFAAFSPQGFVTLPPPAVGWAAFLLLGLVYFATSYLLLGAVFLGIGAHASTAREVQTISMPVTMAQVVVFALSAIAVGDHNSSGALAVAAFPLSSPYVMIARAAEVPGLLPHLVALAWQLLWVALFLRIASRIFRRNVLKSGPVRVAVKQGSRARA